MKKYSGCCCLSWHIIIILTRAHFEQCIDYPACEKCANLQVIQLNMWYVLFKADIVTTLYVVKQTLTDFKHNLKFKQKTKLVETVMKLFQKSFQKTLKIFLNKEIILRNNFLAVFLIVKWKYLVRPPTYLIWNTAVYSVIIYLYIYVCLPIYLSMFFVHFVSCYTYLCANCPFHVVWYWVMDMIQPLHFYTVITVY